MITDDRQMKHSQSSSVDIRVQFLDGREFDARIKHVLLLTRNGQVPQFKALPYVLSLSRLNASPKVVKRPFISLAMNNALIVMALFGRALLCRRSSL